MTRSKANPGARAKGAKGATDLDTYVALALARGVSDARVIRARDVAVREWVFIKCKFGCEGYGQCYTCPPNSPAPEQTRRLLAEYERALLLHHSAPARPARPRRLLNLSKLVAEIERTAFLDGFYRAWAMGCGPCALCRDCPAEGCRHPREARPSMEACGIDVYETARAASFSIDVVRRRDDAWDRFALVLVD
jgi:predicted metal-binding protein